ncbi:hypothetical protein [Calothrix sp. 336/3]|uniref:hypothetical protein n=1 Tax=Calothrix sp. 336/3 TaxID=1337936 RepID=UPI00069C13FB|nr:hypothetical protein [Calothrix sp. 336/3]
MTHLPLPERTDSQKVVGGFYPLQKQELIALRQAKLINNVAYVHLALRYENPFCDRPIEIVAKEFALRWLLPESSLYEALGKLRKLEAIIVKAGKLLVQWAHSQQESDSENPELITESQNELQDVITDSEIPENQCPKPLLEKDFISPQTIQTIQTNKTRAVSEKNAEETAPTDVTPKLPSPQQTQTSAQKDDFQIPQDLQGKLQQLNIPLDTRVRTALSNHDLSQAYGALAHIERTWETINNPRSIFLFQISRQPVEPMGTRLPVKTAADWQWDLEYIKRMYPTTWQEAAAYFGVEVFP